MDATEVTVGAYLHCVERGECKPHEPLPRTVLLAELDPLCRTQWATPALPVVCVRQLMAMGYCRFAGARLPTEQEWEYAFRSGGQTAYPWGDDPPDVRRANVCGRECAATLPENDERQRDAYAGTDGYASAAPVGSFPSGANAFGVLDLAGNVSEWTSSPYHPYGAPSGVDAGESWSIDGRPLRVVRGSNWADARGERQRAHYRTPVERWEAQSNIGFRCVTEPLGG